LKILMLSKMRDFEIENFSLFNVIVLKSS